MRIKRGVNAVKSVEKFSSFRKAISEIKANLIVSPAKR